MREIKFDVIFWDGVDPKTITHPFLDEAFCEDYVRAKEGCLVPTDECTIIRQFTGLQDKNGKDIYEGDLLKWKDVTYGPIEYLESGFGYGGSYGWEDLDSNSCKDFEVIGNIYSNPELLK